MRFSPFILLLGIVSCSFTVLAIDTNDYITTPKAKQIADLGDDDNDGVINARDKCEGTMVGAETDNYGCSTNAQNSEQFEIKVLFANDSSEVSPVFTKEIQLMAEFLQKYPKTSIELQGYASKVGGASYNMQLSEKRADAVKTILVNGGISENRVKTIGFGDSVVESNGDSDLAHALNRQVKASVVGYELETLRKWTIYTMRNK